LIVGVSFALAGTAQTHREGKQEFSADRPGFATTPSVLRRGLTQVEGAATFSVDTVGNTRERSFTFGSLLVRIGVGRSVELRIAGDGFRLDRRYDIVSPPEGRTGLKFERNKRGKT
jgi:hypothetical protein